MKIQIQNIPFDLHIWNKIVDKYLMCYKTPYKRLEDEFIKDLFSVKRFNIYVDGTLIKDYSDYIICVNNNIIDKENNDKLKRIFKSVYTWEIWEDSRLTGKLIEDVEKSKEYNIFNGDYND